MKYVKKKDTDRIRKILQREYDEAVYKKIMTLRNRCGKFLRLFDMAGITEVYESLGEGRKALVSPIVMSDLAVLISMPL